MLRFDGRVFDFAHSSTDTSPGHADQLRTSVSAIYIVELCKRHDEKRSRTHKIQSERGTQVFCFRTQRCGVFIQVSSRKRARQRNGTRIVCILVVQLTKKQMCASRSFRCTSRRHSIASSQPFASSTPKKNCTSGLDST